MYILLFVIIVFCVAFYIQLSLYKKTKYYEQTRINFIKLLYDKGRLGEYTTYNRLKNLSGHKKFLFNVYLPKNNGETTEIDVILLHESGVYVFESKNYSGWIFGTETQKTWTQTLPMGKGRSQKNHFLNPIMQNKGHIKWLKEYVKDNSLPIFSCIVFSDRCTLKDINLTSAEHAVINRYDILKTVSGIVSANDNKLSPEKIDEIYDCLFPLTQVSEETKTAHIRSIQSKTKDSSEIEQQPTESNMKFSETTEFNDEVQTDEMTCPKCGSNLIIRTASKGKYQGNKFYGCSNYPKCRYTQKL